MATLTRSNSRATAPGYKDYVNFLDGYKSGKKTQISPDRSPSVGSLVISPSSSASSLSNKPEPENPAKNLTLDAPDFSKTACTPYGTYLEISKTKKFTPVRRSVEEKPTMKSEIFIEIQPTKSVSEVSRMFELKEKKVVPKSSKINSKISIFENTDSKPKIAPHKPVVPKLPEIRRDVEPVDDLPLPPPPPPETGEAEEDFPPPPPPLFASPESNPSVLPPPPPLPTPTRIQATLTKGPQTTYSVSHTSGPVPNEIDRNNPVVKKLVYGALRGLYGAYHDKANDMMATLPKNMVVKSNGVQDRIDQIASCGGLEKINGRVNPKQEQE